MTNRFFSFNNPVLWVAAIVLFPVTLLVIGFMMIRGICKHMGRGNGAVSNNVAHEDDDENLIARVDPYNIYNAYNPYGDHHD